MWRDHELKNSDLLKVDEGILERVAGIEPGTPGYYKFKRDPLEHAPSTKPRLVVPGEEGLEINPNVPVTPDMQQITEYNEALQQNVPIDVAEDILMEGISALRGDLKDVEAAQQVLALWITRFETIWNSIVQMRKLFEQGRSELAEVINLSSDKAIATLDGIYNTMNTAEIIAINHNDVLWRIDDVLKRVGKTYGKDWATEIGPEEEVAFPMKEESGKKKLYSKIEYLSWWISQKERREKIYTNIEEAARSAWRRYQTITGIVGPWLIRHKGQRIAQQADLPEILQDLQKDVEHLLSTLQPLEDSNDKLNSILYDIEGNLDNTLSRVAKINNIMSPDEWSRLAGLDVDKLNFLEGGDISTSQTTPGDLSPTVAPPVKDKPVELEPLPIDDEEFLRIRFPEITRFPTSTWGKMQIAGTYLHKIRITYTKVTPPEEGITKTYVVHPYSFRIRRPQRTGRSPVWYLFAEDDRDRHIKAFIYRNISEVKILPETFNPRWEVEFNYA